MDTLPEVMYLAVVPATMVLPIMPSGAVVVIGRGSSSCSSWSMGCSVAMAGGGERVSDGGVAERNADCDSTRRSINESWSFSNGPSSALSRVRAKSVVLAVSRKFSSREVGSVVSQISHRAAVATKIANPCRMRRPKVLLVRFFCMVSHLRQLYAPMCVNRTR